MFNQENKVTKNLPIGNMAHGIDGEALTQSSEGIHQWDADNDTACGDLALNFNVNATKNGEGIIFETFKNDTYSAFFSDDRSTEKLSKCMNEAFDYLSAKIPHKAQLIRSILLSLVGIVLFNEEEACTSSSQERAFEMFGK
jgi:hypothetical protein